MNENKEVCELADIMVSRVIEQLGDPKLLASKLVSTLGELTKQDSAEEDIGLEGAKYHATRLALELGNVKNDSDKDRRYINRIWKDLVEAFEVIQPSIENDARKAEYRKILKPRKTDPKTGRVEFYFEEIELEASVLDGEKHTATKDGKPIIYYERTKNPKPSFVGRIFAKIAIANFFVRLVYASLPLVLMTGLYVFYDYLVDHNDGYITNGFFLYCYVCAWLIFLFRPYYVVWDQIITMAPFWVTPIIGDERAQLEIRRSGKLDSFGEHTPEIGLTVYKSECLVCGKEVNICKGTNEFKGRLIGKCIASPREHIYSFDHMTQKGVPLRSDTYLG